MTKSYDERREALKMKRAQLEARMRDLDQSEAVARRKRDARRKIVVGAAVISAMTKDERAFDRFMRRFDELLTRPGDRQLFELPEHRLGSNERLGGGEPRYSRRWMKS